MPALARWAAMPLPMTPAPITPTRRIGFVMQKTSRLRVGTALFLVFAAVRKPFWWQPVRRGRGVREICVTVGAARLPAA